MDLSPDNGRKKKKVAKEPVHILYSLSYIYISLIILILIIVYINYYVYKKYGVEKTKLLFQFPFTFLASMFVFFAIGKIGYDTIQSVEINNKETQRGLSLYTQDVVVDRWEADAMNYPSINNLYKEIFSKATGDSNHFYTRDEWVAAGYGHIPYVPYDGNEEKWHYAAKFIQEMANIVRMFHLEEKFRVNVTEDLIKSNEGAFAGWITCFRMYLSNPLVRNVWEQYKYRHVNPKFSAWVKYYVTDVVEQNPNFFKDHVKNWDIEVSKWLE